MGRGLNRLSAVKVARLKSPGYYADGGCLYLRVAPGGSKGWIFRFAIAGRTRDAGLGSYPAITLVTAREEAEYRRRLVAAGVDPIDAKRKEREAELLATSKARPSSNAQSPLSPRTQLMHKPRAHRPKEACEGRSLRGDK
jgi:Arm DNA-binding domain